MMLRLKTRPMPVSYNPAIRDNYNSGKFFCGGFAVIVYKINIFKIHAITANQRGYFLKMAIIFLLQDAIFGSM